MRKTLILVMASVALAGCMGPRKHELPPVYLTAGPEALLASYNDNAARIDTLSAEVSMTFTTPGKVRPRQYRVSAWLDVEKPGRLRLIHDSLGRELFDIVSDGNRFWVGLDRSITGEEDTVYTGRLGEVEREWYLRPDRLMAAFSLAALPPADSAETFFEGYRDRYVLGFVDESKPRKVVSLATFDRRTLRLSRYQVFDESAQLVLDVEYRSYDEVGAAAVPDLLYIVWPQDNFSVVAKVSKIKVGVTLPARLWEFHWRDNAQVIEIGPPEASPE